MPRKFRQREQPRPLLGSREAFRLGSLLFMLVVLWMMFQRARDPATWRWLAGDVKHGVAEAAEAPPAAKPAIQKWKPTIVPGPTDLDPAEQQAFKRDAQAITDKEPIAAIEMPTYWRMLRWAKAQSMQDLAKRGRTDLLLRHLYEEPERHRGELVSLSLHVKQIVKWADVPNNPAGAKDIYEIWGVTDDSLSFPYVVVVDELPPQLKPGTDLTEEAVFSGYFIKLLEYQSFNVHRAAPLLIGRAEWRENTARTLLAAQQEAGKEYIWPVLVGGLLLLGAIIASWFLVRRRPKREKVAAEEEVAVDKWLSNAESDPPGGFDYGDGTHGPGYGSDRGSGRQSPTLYDPFD